MNQIAYFELFAFNPSTCNFDRWVGTGPRSTAKKHGLWADPASLMYGDEKLCVDGFACKAGQRAA
jgi:hypothetical protein